MRVDAIYAVQAAESRRDNHDEVKPQLTYLRQLPAFIHGQRNNLFSRQVFAVDARARRRRIRTGQAVNWRDLASMALEIGNRARIFIWRNDAHRERISPVLISRHRAKRVAKSVSYKRLGASFEPRRRDFFVQLVFIKLGCARSVQIIM